MQTSLTSRVAMPSPGLNCCRGMPLCCLFLSAQRGAAGQAGAKPALQLCPPAAPQGPTPKPLGLRGLWRWRQQGQGHWAWGQQEGDEEGRCRHFHWRGSGCPSLGGKDPFWVPTTHLLFSFTNLVIKKKNISPFLNF